MPRKRAVQAEAEAQRAQETRWRYLLRNHNFRRDLQDLSCIQDIGKFISAQEKIADKWGLLRIPPQAILWQLYFGESENLPSLESLGSEWGIVYSPVVVTELRAERFLFLRVDLTHPADDLLPLIEKELRQVARARPHHRRRLDTVDFHLQVFDLAAMGKTFLEIAKKLTRRLSTVKSAYMAARRNIFGPTNVPRRKALLLDTFDASSHLGRCFTCRTATTSDEMCPQFRLQISQDTKGQRELTGYDTTR